jgi:hypothetical protein
MTFCGSAKNHLPRRVGVIFAGITRIERAKSLRERG